MSDAPAILCRYDGDGEFKAVNPVWARRADNSYVIGEQYYVEPRQARSMNSHRHLFAIINAAWETLPEKYVLDFPSAEHFRKWLLIKAGMYNEVKSAWPSEKLAARVAAEIRATDEFSIVLAEGKIVSRYEAKSMSMKAMDKKTFQDTKNKILEIIDGMIGTTPGQVEKNIGAAA